MSGRRDAQSNDESRSVLGETNGVIGDNRALEGNGSIGGAAAATEGTEILRRPQRASNHPMVQQPASTRPLLGGGVGDSTKEYDSLNYERMINQFFITNQVKNYRKGNRKIFGYTGRTLTRWVLTVFIGVSTALVAKLLIVLIEKLTEFRQGRLEAFQTNLEGIGWDHLLIFIGLAGWNVLLASIACLLVLFVSPQAAGSGIPEVKAYLNGTHIPYFLSSNAFLVTLIGTVLSVSSGLFVGPEGPLVHLGAVLGSAVTRGFKNIRWRWRGKRYVRHISLSWLMPFRNDSDRRDFISIGVAAGFAAAFGAPIGGVLFSLEEASSFWSGKLMWRAMTAAALSCLILNATESGNLSYFGLISLRGSGKGDGEGGILDLDNSIAVLPAFALLGAIGGLLGALFNGLWKRFSPYRPKTRRGKFAEVVGLTLLTTFASYELAIWTHICSQNRDDWVDPNFPLQFNCPDGKFNELASILLGLKENVIKEIITDPTKFRTYTLIICFALCFPLQLLTFGSHVPAGIFMPTIVLGCVLGGAFGNILSHHWYTDINNPGAFSLMGAVAMLGGLQRTTISLCVIMMEGTGETEYLLPIIFTTVVANYVGNYFNHGVYEIAMENKKIPFLDHNIHQQFHVFQARHCMAHDVRVVQVREPVANIISLLGTCDHSGFPVVAPGSRKFVGFVLRDQLYTLLESLDFAGSRDLHKGNFLEKIQVPNVRKKAHSFEALRNVNLSDMEKSLPIDLEPAMNIGPHCITPDCPFSRCYMMFCSLGLRHLVVVNADHDVIGIITRKDLLKIEHVVRNGSLTFQEKSTIVDELSRESSSSPHPRVAEPPESIRLSSFLNPQSGATGILADDIASSSKDAAVAAERSRVEYDDVPDGDSGK